MSNKESFLRKRTEYDSLPVFQITFDPEDDKQGIEFISLVSDPAIDIKGQYFGTTQRHEFKPVKDQMMIVGPFMRPNYKILRRDGDYEFFVFFTAETIKQMQQKFNKENNNKAINFDHTDRMVNAFVDQNWLIESSDYDKSKMWGYEGLELGTWFGMVKIEDQEFWDNEVKELGKYSFSIEGFMGTTPHQMIKNYMSKDDFIQSLLRFKKDLKKAGNITDEEYLEIFSSATGTGIRIGYDFDGVLNTPKGESQAMRDIKAGNQVFVVTKRGLLNQSEVYTVSDRLGIPRENVVFTQGKYKYNYLRNLFIDIFYDDTAEEIDKINRNSGVVGKLFKIN